MIGGCAGVSQGGIVWDEIGQGDLSNDYATPTAVPVEVGENLVLGNIGEGAVGIDRDYFSIRVEAGWVLRSIVIEYYFGDDPIAFFGAVAGSGFAVSGDDATPSDVDGYVLFGSAGLNVAGTDVLPVMAASQSPSRLDVPLGAGVYSFWVQQLDGLSEYGLKFVVEVPSPGVVGAWVAMWCVAGGVRRRGVR